MYINVVKTPRRPEKAESGLRNLLSFVELIVRHGIFFSGEYLHHELLQ